MSRGAHAGRTLTVDALADLDDVAERHGFVVFGRKMRQNTGAEGDLLVHVALGETEVAELEFGRDVCAEIGVHNTERVEVGDMMPSYLVCTHEQLDLENACQYGCPRDHE